MDQKPSVGRIVHFQTHGSNANGGIPSEETAALVTKVWSDTCVNLTVFYDTGVSFKKSIEHSAAPKAGHWSWPPRV